MNTLISVLSARISAATPPLQVGAGPFLAPPAFLGPGLKPSPTEPAQPARKQPDMQQLATIAAHISKLDAAGFDVIGLDVASELPVFTVRLANRRQRGISVREL